MIKHKLTKITIGLLISTGVCAHSLYPQVDIPVIDNKQLVSSDVPQEIISESLFVFRPYQRPFDATHFLQKNAQNGQRCQKY